MPKHDHLEALGGMNIMFNKTARTVPEAYHAGFNFYPIIGAVGALVLVCPRIGPRVGA